jgi:hypothetical protein
MTDHKRQPTLEEAEQAQLRITFPCPHRNVVEQVPQTETKCH